jgi:diguanylate cyclase (GGDEF)-like protein/PAS domain S-box-containing protein
MAATNEWHGLLWSSFTPTIQSGIHMLIYGHGIWFWINTVYLYALMTVAVVTLISAVAHSDHLYRRQAGAVVFAVVLPLVSGCIYMSGLNPWPGLDLTPIGIVLSGPILAWGLFQLRLFDLVPVARHVLLETMSEGLLVLDVQRRIADVNPAARRLMGIGDERLIGMQVSALPGLWPHVITQHCAETAMETETAVGADGLRCVDMRVTPLCDRHGRVTGHLVVARDISERKRVENALRASSERLQAQLTENEALQCRLHEQAIRDPLTDLFNRRYLEETLVRELARSVRDERPVCVLMFDLDKFKHINDKLGHAAGDAVLQAVGQVLASRTRRGDVACRYGGDEFVVVLPATDLESACYRANELLDAVDALRIPYTERILVTKASCGIAAFPEHSQTGDDLLRLTDRALYMAKARGGGCVVMFGERHELVRWT